MLEPSGAPLNGQGALQLMGTAAEQVGKNGADGNSMHDLRYLPLEIQIVIFAGIGAMPQRKSHVRMAPDTQEGVRSPKQHT